MSYTMSYIYTQSTVVTPDQKCYSEKDGSNYAVTGGPLYNALTSVITVGDESPYLGGFLK
jgi:hypothetical protein